MTAQTDWWANLLQGALSAMIGGVVAALTAWAVVTITARQTRRQAAQQNAVHAAQALTADLYALVEAVFTIEPWRRRRSSADRRRLATAIVRFFTFSLTRQAVINAWDPAFADQMLQRHAAIENILVKENEGIGLAARRQWSEEDVNQFDRLGSQFFRELRVWLMEQQTS
ncbi:MAG: hypothetical protein JWQ95_3577 [Sphaerisporangium sp.]|nr:hypothetical protein [Sphaerisporangium sp.]